MSHTARPLADVNRAGHAALVRELGVADAIRFLNQYTTGQGDYTADRHEWLGDESVEGLFREMEGADRKRPG